MPKGVKKGIILAGGTGTRLFPVTRAVCKQLLPVYDKPMIYYPLATLMQMGISEILIITTSEYRSQFQLLLEDGRQLGLKIQYAVQTKPNGIAEAFIIGDDFIEQDNVALILGDNIFYGNSDFYESAGSFEGGGTVFAYYVSQAERYGVVELDNRGNAVSIVEKPNLPKSHYAVTGLYIYDSSVIEIARKLKPSDRGEIEITDINNDYLKQGRLKVILLERGVGWLDTGTHESMLEAGNFIKTIENRQGSKIACIEEIALNKGLIDRKQFAELISKMGKNTYHDYLKAVLHGVESEG